MNMLNAFKSYTNSPDLILLDYGTLFGEHFRRKFTTVEVSISISKTKNSSYCPCMVITVRSKGITIKHQCSVQGLSSVL